MGYHLLPANPAGDVDRVRADTVGLQPASQMGRSLGEVDDTLPDGAFLRGDALLRKIAMFYNYLYINCKTLSI